MKTPYLGIPSKIIVLVLLIPSIYKNWKLANRLYERLKNQFKGTELEDQLSHYKKRLIFNSVVLAIVVCDFYSVLIDKKISFQNRKNLILFTFCTFILDDMTDEEGFTALEFNHYLENRTINASLDGFYSTCFKVFQNELLQTLIDERIIGFTKQIIHFQQENILPRVKSFENACLVDYGKGGITNLLCILISFPNTNIEEYEFIKTTGSMMMIVDNIIDAKKDLKEDKFSMISQSKNIHQVFEEYNNLSKLYQKLSERFPIQNVSKYQFLCNSLFAHYEIRKSEILKSGLIDINEINDSNLFSPDMRKWKYLKLYLSYL